MAGLITSVVLPFVIYTKVVWVDPAPILYSPVAQTATTSVGHHYFSSYNQLPAVEEESFEINWNLVSLAIYAIGFTAFMLKFAIDFYSLNSVLKGKKSSNKKISNLLMLQKTLLLFLISIISCTTHHCTAKQNCKAFSNTRKYTAINIIQSM
ncbi:hypothetical protein ACQ9BO_16835 [Flavobacterium sp. P21]|uniref:hypothetical protein n=1 Tax=Flavobacterium sp. P21 TaxID=3423948 RepID=UPI003D67133E